MRAAAKLVPGGFAAEASPRIVCEGIRHVYRSASGDETLALSDVSLSFADGEFVCLLGPSGCGKTTLLNMIAGFLRPSGGTIAVDGRPVVEPSPDRGVVFQDYSLFPWLTVRGNVQFGLKMAGVPPRERRKVADDCLGWVGLATAGDRYPFELSGGMKQRVAIARAIAPGPKVLLMDEPFAALDALTRASLQNDLLELHQRDAKTVVFVTHNIGEAIFLADRVVVMSPHPGRVVEDVRVDIARPRRRTSTAFNDLYERLASAIGVNVLD